MLTPLFLSLLAAPAAPAAAVRLWPAAAPHAVSTADADVPKVTPYLVKSDAPTAAVVVCPGGGYGFLAADHEGEQVATFFNKIGVSAFVLQYRIVTKERPGPLHPAPLTDAQRAIRFVRAKAAEYNLDPKRVGIMGFSAGGHLASTAGTHFDAGDPKADDAVEKMSCRPDFLVLAYPVISFQDGVTHGGSRNNLIGSKPDAKLIEYYSNEKQVTADTPPTFIFHTNEDTAVIPENAVAFYLALKAKKVPVEMHIYEKGRHGVGLGTDPKWTGGETSCGTWPDRLTDWLKARKLVK